MRRFLLTTILLMTTSPAYADMAELPRVAPACDITVSFGSAGHGTDADTGQSMRAYLEGMTSTLSYTEKTWGSEGQYDYCVTLGNRDDSRAVYRQLRSLLPIDKSGTPPVMIKANHQRAKTIDPVNDPVPPLPDDRL